jgi:hypothetical protein
MEKPYPGKSTITETIGGLDILIPTPKNWFAIIFTGAWLCGWALGEIFVLIKLISGIEEVFVNLFMLFWLIMWTAGGVMTFRTFYWMAFGYELISFDRGQLTIDFDGLLLAKPKSYDPRDIRKVRVSEGGWATDVWGNSRFMYLMPGKTGKIKFDYGLKSIGFAIGIDESEAHFIINKLKEKGILTESNFIT